MREEKKISLEVVLERLQVAGNYPFGMNHLAVLIHCWRKRHPDEAPSHSVLYERKKADGFAWFTPYELQAFSRYEGYDLNA